LTDFGVIFWIAVNNKIVFARSVNRTNSEELKEGELFIMYKKEIAEIENLIQKQNRWRNQCINLIDRKSVKEEVNRFRSEYQEVKYSYDEINQQELKVAK